MSSTLEQRNEMKALLNFDPELSHSKADKILVTVLRDYGEEELCDLFNALTKWYA